MENMIVYDEFGDAVLPEHEDYVPFSEFSWDEKFNWARFSSLPEDNEIPEDDNFPQQNLIN